MNDTTPEAAEVQMRILRAMPPERRLRLAGSLTRSVRGMIRSQLRKDYPAASEARIKRLLAERWLGPELAAKAYGPLMSDG